MANIFAETVQLNNLNTAGNSITLNMICEIMTNNAFGKPIERIGLVNKLILQERNQTEMYYNYNEMIRQLKDESIYSMIAGAGERQWFYQACNQLGFFQTTTLKPEIFGNANIPLEFYINKCIDVFGGGGDGVSYTNKTIQKFIANTNNRYGGRKPFILLPTVMSVEGSNDPWNQIGIIKSIPNSVNAILIPGTAHCADMYASSNKDLPQLTQARIAIIAFLQKIMMSNENIDYEKSKNIHHQSSNSNNNGLLIKLLKIIPLTKRIIFFKKENIGFTIDNSLSKSNTIISSSSNNNSSNDVTYN